MLRSSDSVLVRLFEGTEYPEFAANTFQRNKNFVPADLRSGNLGPDENVRSPGLIRWSAEGHR